MSDKYITVAGFADPVGADIARGRLESEGIPVVVTGGMAATTFSAIGNLGGRVELRVASEHLDRAVQILAECGDADHLTDEARAEADEGPVWICSLCGDLVRAVLPLCPACHTPRGKVPDYHPGDDESEEGIQTADAPRAAKVTEHGVKKPGEVMPESPPALPRLEGGASPEEPTLTTMFGDGLARRAFYAALFGPATAGLLSVYSAWLLGKLAFYRGELSARGMRYLYLAMAFTGFYLLLGFLICAGLS